MLSRSPLANQARNKTHILRVHEQLFNSWIQGAARPILSLHALFLLRATERARQKSNREEFDAS